MKLHNIFLNKYITRFFKPSFLYGKIISHFHNLVDKILQSKIIFILMASERPHRLFKEQAIDNSNEKLLIKKLIKFDLILLDDFGLNHIPSGIESILLDFIDSFSMYGSLLITSQFSYDL